MRAACSATTAGPCSLRCVHSRAALPAIQPAGTQREAERRGGANILLQASPTSRKMKEAGMQSTRNQEEDQKSKDVATCISPPAGGQQFSSPRALCWGGRSIAKQQEGEGEMEAMRRLPAKPQGLQPSLAFTFCMMLNDFNCFRPNVGL